METMPFTLAHAAAALPFRRTGLILSAVVVGSFAPDFEYFLRLAPGGHFGHKLPGVFVLDLPLSLVVLWLFHAYMREPMVALLPDAVQRRICPGPRTFRFWGPARLALVAGSILVGIVTHIVWDSFTHPSLWLYGHWDLLSERVRVPGLGAVQYYRLFQHGSTIVGSAILAIWLLHWYRATRPEQRRPARLFSLAWDRGLLAFVFVIALSGALIRALVGVGIPHGPRLAETFLGYAAITAISLIWLQWLVYGIFWTRQQRLSRQG
jgi:hypothetical protein